MLLLASALRRCLRRYRLARKGRQSRPKLPGSQKEVTGLHHTHPEKKLSAQNFFVPFSLRVLNLSCVLNISLTPVACCGLHREDALMEDYDYKTAKKETPLKISADRHGNIFAVHKKTGERVYIGSKTEEIDEDAFWDLYLWWKEGNTGEPTQMLPF